jgi:hypothetical protein
MFDIFFPEKKYQTLFVYKGLFAPAQINPLQTLSRVSAHVQRMKKLITPWMHKLEKIEAHLYTLK